MMLDERQRCTVYAALKTWINLLAGETFHTKELKDLASEGGKLKPLSGTEIRLLMNQLVEERHGVKPKEKPAKEFSQLKVAEWLRKGEFNAANIDTVEDVIHQAGRLLDKSCSGDICGETVFKLEDGKWYVGNVEFCVDEINPAYLKELQDAAEEE